MRNIPLRNLTTQQLHSISYSTTPQGLIALIKIPVDFHSETIPEQTGDRILLLEHVQDPGNVGTLIRTAVAFGYSGIIMSSDCADPFSPKVVQASAGALFSVWIRRTKSYLSLINTLKSNNYVLLGADVHGSAHIDFKRSRRHILALGNEGAGLSRDILNNADVRFSIPMNAENIESLNVAVSGAIAMFAGMQAGGW